MLAAKHCAMLFSSGQNRLCVFAVYEKALPDNVSNYGFSTKVLLSYIFKKRMAENVEEIEVSLQNLSRDLTILGQQRDDNGEKTLYDVA